MKVPTLETERLFLKSVCLEDTDAYTKYFAHWNIIKWLRQIPWPYNRSHTEDFIKKYLEIEGNERWIWGLHLKNNPEELIGVVDLMRESPYGHKSNRGLWLGEPFQKHGYMLEAIKAINTYAFTHLKFEVLYFNNSVINENSRRLKEKTGAVKIGTYFDICMEHKKIELEHWMLTKENWLNFIKEENSTCE